MTTPEFFGRTIQPLLIDSSTSSLRNATTQGLTVARAKIES